MSLDKLQYHREVWHKKPLLRRLYHEWYRMIDAQLKKPGKSLEIGSGTGNMKDFFPDIISADIVPAPWVDIVMDAHQIPLTDNSLENIILFDVLHHLENPTLFFKETQRVLAPGGRAIFLEPYISLCSYPVYNWLHPEPVDMGADPFALVAPDPAREPFDSNQAIPTLMFTKQLDRFKTMFPSLKLIHIERCATLLYPLSGGFEKPSLVPYVFYGFFKWIEKQISFLSKYMSFRLFVVIEKDSSLA